MIIKYARDGYRTKQRWYFWWEGFHKKWQFKRAKREGLSVIPKEWQFKRAKREGLSVIPKEWSCSKQR